MAELDGKIAFVTGGSRGIGKAIGLLFAEKGAHVFVAGTTMAGASAAAAEIGHGAVPVMLDVADEASWADAMDQVRGQCGKLDILVNAAGLCVGNDIEDGAVTDLRRHMAVNVEGVFIGCQAALALLREAGGKGSIVNIGSVIVPRPTAGLLAYGASKAAMTAMSKSIALHCARNRLGIRVNVIHPGGIETDMMEQALAESGQPREEAYAMWLTTQPTGRFGLPSEIAGAALYLASDASSFTTGAELRVDGAGSIR